MTKHKLLVIGIVGLLLSACGTEVKKEETVVENKVTPTVVVNNLIWKDEAGFNFSYPENIKITADASDNVSYANLTTSDGVKILAIDSKYKDVGAWVKGEAKFKDGLIIDSQLGGKDGKKIVKDGVTTVGIIDDSILFTVEIPANNASGSQIVDSFELVYPTPMPAAKGVPVDDGGEVVEEEEVVE